MPPTSLRPLSTLRPSLVTPVYGARERRQPLASLASVGAIDTMLSNFILPLQENADASSRIHCSLNLNTETGRLSSRQPNLQNQPALEKDQYKIRAAFCAEEEGAAAADQTIRASASSRERRMQTTLSF